MVGVYWKDREKYGLILTAILVAVVALVSFLLGGDTSGDEWCPPLPNSAKSQLVQGEPSVCVYTLEDGSITQEPATRK